MNYISAGTVIADSVSALGVMIAFYYGLTGFECVWFYPQRTLCGESVDGTSGCAASCRCSAG